ncbi:putative polyubiquitin, partial [Tanacetum coccineum]
SYDLDPILRSRSCKDKNDPRWDRDLDSLGLHTQHRPQVRKTLLPFVNIMNVRLQIQRKLHIPVCMQKLFFAQVELEDGFTIFDYCIHNESTLHLVLRSWQCIMVKYSDTIHNVKVKIHDKLGIPTYPQTLLLDRKQLDDSRTLVDYGVYNGYTLYLVLTTWIGFMRIFVKTAHNRKTISLEVKGSNTLGDLKSMINDEESVLENQKILLYNGDQLDDNSRTLADCYIHKESIHPTSFSYINGS